MPCREIAKRLKRIGRLRPGARRRGRHRPRRRGGAGTRQRPRIHTFISTSPVHRKHKLQKSAGAGAGDGALPGHPRAQPGASDVEWSARGRHPHRARLSVPLRGDRASRPAPPPSTCPTPSATPRPRNTARCSATVMEKVPGSEKVIFSTHCHNDLGLAVANSLAGVQRRRAAGRMHHQRHRRAGRQRRAGRDRHGHQDARRRAALRRSASTPRCSTAPPSWCRRRPRFPVQYNKAIVGKNAFAHESGIHQDGMLKHRRPTRS